MKTFLISITIILSCLILSCNTETRNVCTVEISVPQSEYDSASYFISKDQLNAYSLWPFETMYFDSTGNLDLTIESDGINWLFFTFFPNTYKGNEYKKKNRVFLLAQPGKHYSIEFDSTCPMLFRIEGDHAKAQTCFNQLSHQQSNMGFPTWFSNSDESVKSLLRHLQDSINNSLWPFIVLRDNKEIDKEYYNTVKKNIQYSHAMSLLESTESRLSAYHNPQLRRLHEDLHPLYLSDYDINAIKEYIFNKYPVTRKEAGLVPLHCEYLDNYLLFKVNQKPNTRSSYQGKLKLVNAASEYLDEELLELYFAHQFQSASLKFGTDSLATYLFPEFKKQYPDSRFMHGVIRSIEHLTNFYVGFYPGLNDSKPDVEGRNIVKTILPPEYRFIEEEEDPISSFDTLLSRFKGKNLFIDFWASWCPPCRYEFRFNDTLHSFLDAHDIELLYISSDKDENKWLNTIQNYKLTGHHFRITNEELRKELRSMAHFIPTYMIVDSTGVILETDAEKPHTKSLLFNQLIEVLGLE